MNSAQLEYLASDDWKDRLKSNLEPWIDNTATLGEDLVEIGPGPGLTPDILLAERMSGTNVEVVAGHAGHAFRNRTLQRSHGLHHVA